MEPAEVHFVHEAVEGREVEGPPEVGEVLPDRPPAEALAAAEEAGGRHRRVVKEALLQKVLHAGVGVLIGKDNY